MKKCRTVANSATMFCNEAYIVFSGCNRNILQRRMSQSSNGDVSLVDLSPPVHSATHDINGLVKFKSGTQLHSSPFILQLTQNRLTQIFFKGSSFWPRPPPANLKTPPYVTSQPVVTYRTEFIQPCLASSPPPPRSKMRFLILATDGLWDRLTSQEACALVAGHLAGFRGAVPKRDLENQLKLAIGTRGIEGKDRAGKETREDGDRSWMFKDENLATHLTRNAFGKGNEARLRELLSIPAPLARSYRDDVTVTVVWWEEGHESEKQQIKTKL